MNITAKLSNISVIAFDADDTLWANEPYFKEMEHIFGEMMHDYLPHEEALKRLFATEARNTRDYGVGIKSMILSMIETAITLSDGRVGAASVEKIIQLGKEMLHKPVEILDGVEDVLKALQGAYRLVVVTKGDMLDQQRKLRKSGLEQYFHHIEIVPDKTELEYQKLLAHLDIQPHEFAMVGNSLKSDILPVLNIGGYGFHVPYHVIWENEKIDTVPNHAHFFELTNARNLLPFVI